jgi:hypothetical protein
MSHRASKQAWPRLFQMAEPLLVDLNTEEHCANHPFHASTNPYLFSAPNGIGPLKFALASGTAAHSGKGGASADVFDPPPCEDVSRRNRA